MPTQTDFEIALQAECDSTYGAWLAFYCEGKPLTSAQMDTVIRIANKVKAGSSISLDSTNCHHISLAR